MALRLIPRLFACSPFHSSAAAQRYRRHHPMALQVCSISTKQTYSAAVPASKAKQYNDWDNEEAATDLQSLLSKETVGKKAKKTKYDLNTSEGFRQKYLDALNERSKETYKSDTLPEHEWRGVLQLMFQSPGIAFEKVQAMHLILGTEKKYRDHHRKEAEHRAAAQDQILLQDRIDALGPELAVVHFVAYRGGRVRCHGSDVWYDVALETDRKLPQKEEGAGLKVRDIDASSMKLLYEGLEQFEGCSSLESINLSGSEFVDNFFIDRICKQHHMTLKKLDISNCPQLTVGAITALVRLTKLREVNLRGVHCENLALACLTLEDELPGLVITGLILSNDNLLPQEQVDEVYARLQPDKRQNTPT